MIRCKLSQIRDISARPSCLVNTLLYHQI